MWFIPVDTGNTCFDHRTVIDRTVYPCVYREHVIDSAVLAAINGLSLCIQGTLLKHSSDQLKVRFIPVYTGNTLLLKFCPPIPAVYPCVYREHYPVILLARRFSGLSLCIQGTPFAHRGRVYRVRFIPVYTGNTPANAKPPPNVAGLSLCIQGTLDRLQEIITI